MESELTVDVSARLNTPSKNRGVFSLQQGAAQTVSLVSHVTPAAHDSNWQGRSVSCTLPRRVSLLDSTMQLPQPVAFPLPMSLQHSKASATALRRGMPCVRTLTKPLLILYVTLLMGAGLFVNGIASSHGNTGVLLSGLLLSLGRLCGAWCIAVLFKCVPSLNPTPPLTGPEHNFKGVPTLAWAALIGLGQSMMNAVFIYANTMGSVAIYGPLAGLHSAVTMTYGLLAQSQPRTPSRIFGIVLSAVSVVLLGVAQSEGSASDGPGSQSLHGVWRVLFPVLIGSFMIAGWGALDILSVEVGRRLPRSQAAFGMGCGQVIAALVFALACAGGLEIGGQAQPVPLQVDAFGWLLFGVNVLGVTAWIGFVVLGAIAHINEFVPVTSLYGVVTAGLGYSVFLQVPSALAVVSVLMAAVAVVAVSVAPNEVEVAQVPPLAPPSAEAPKRKIGIYNPSPMHTPDSLLKASLLSAEQPPPLSLSHTPHAALAPPPSLTGEGTPLSPTDIQELQYAATDAQWICLCARRSSAVGRALVWFIEHDVKCGRKWGAGGLPQSQGGVHSGLLSSESDETSQ